jgi:hypothetical protein
MSFVKFTGNVDLDSHKILNLANPSASSDGANKGYVDSAIAAINPAKVVHASDASLTAWIASSSYASNISSYPAGTVLLLPSASSAESGQYFQNGGSAGTEADWSLLGNAPSASEVRSHLSAGSGLAFSGGAFSVSSAIKGMIGDGSATSFTISVPIDDVVISVREASSGEFVGVQAAVASGVVTLTFASAPSSNQYKYCIIPGY